jgi:hypothetical protein
MKRTCRCLEYDYFKTYVISFKIQFKMDEAKGMCLTNQESLNYLKYSHHPHKQIRPRLSSKVLFFVFIVLLVCRVTCL